MAPCTSSTAGASVSGPQSEHIWGRRCAVGPSPGNHRAMGRSSLQQLTTFKLYSKCTVSTKIWQLLGHSGSFLKYHSGVKCPQILLKIFSNLLLLLLHIQVHNILYSILYELYENPFCRYIVIRLNSSYEKVESDMLKKS